jgi:hypothetical protein
MTIQQEIRIGWKKLKTILEDFRKAINHNQPVRGDGITIDETDSGCVISILRQVGGADPGVTPDGETPDWHQIRIVDESCKMFSMWVWSGSPKATQ